MNTKSSVIKRLKEAVAKAIARASAAKDELRAAKGRLKQARKLFKAEKKAAKQARRKLDAAVATAAARTPRPAATLKLKPAIRRPPTAKKSPPKKTGLKKAALKRAAPKKAGQRRTPKPVAVKAPITIRSAAEVAKSVIERLHAPPPTLPPTLAPVIPQNIAAARDDLPGSAPTNT
jgi:hypothetical protein